MPRIPATGIRRLSPRPHRPDGPRPGRARTRRRPTVHEVPATLPARLYLLAYDLRKRRHAPNLRFPYMIRAAALTDLLLSGHITDESGKPRAVPEAGPVADPVLAELLTAIAEARPKSWQRWIHDDAKKTVHAVRDRLVANRWIKLEERRPFLIFRQTIVHVRDTRVVRRLAARVSAALSGPLSRVDERDAAMVVLAAEGHLATVLPRERRRTHKARITALRERTGPAAEAFRKVIQAANSAAVAGAG
nr:MAG: GPP34 family phosphoprotein [Actinomycetota bacterium]